MATSKRKRNSTKPIPNNKRQKPAPPSSDDEGSPAKAILDERRRVDGQVEYLVDWEDNPLTGEPYDPSWSLECGEDLLEEWNRKKSAIKSSGPSKIQRKRSAPQLKSYTPKRSKRQSKVAESSPELPSASAPSIPLPTAQSTESQTLAPPSPAKPHESPQVHINKRKSPILGFEYYSQLPASPTPSFSSTRQSLLSSQSSYTGPRNYLSSGIVYDSEEEDAVDGSNSYVPPTQDASTSINASTQQQSSTSEGCSDFSPLFVPPASPAISISISIPETEPEPFEHGPIEDSQAQSQLPPVSPSQSAEQPEAPENLDIIVATSQAAPLESEEGQRTHEEVRVSDNEEEPSRAVAAKEAGLAIVDEDNAPVVAQESEQTTLLDSIAEPSQVEDQPAVEGQVAVSELPEVSAPSATQTVPQLPEPGSPNNEEQPASTEQDSGLEPQDTQPPIGELSRRRSPSAPHSQEEQQLPGQKSTEAPELPPTVAEDLPARDSTHLENISSSVQPLVPDIEVVEQIRPASVVQGQDQPTSPSVEPSFAQPARNIEQSSQRLSLNTTVQASKATQEDLVQDTVNRQNPILSSPNGCRSDPPSPAYPTPSQQHAQRVPVDTLSTTDNDVPESIRTTIEKDVLVTTQDPSSPQSRHDSSQESPDPPESSAPVSSALPPPPAHSLDTLGFNAPPRLHTPARSSQTARSPVMGIDPEEEELWAEYRELAEQKQRENPYTPRRTLKKSKMFSETGTRSPSTVPNREPMPQASTSLRTVASSNSMAEASNTLAPDAGPSEPAPVQEEGDSGTSDSNNKASAPAVPASTDEELSDVDDISALNDDLQLQPREWIVPLPMDGRQAVMYRDALRDNQDVLDGFMLDPKKFEPIEKVERILSRLQALETHIDLAYSASQPSQEIGSSTQLQHEAQWSFDNSIKFRFIGTLFHRLQDRNMHVVLVLSQDDTRLFDMVENFLKGRFVNFKSPTRGHAADLTHVEGNLMVTILPRNSSQIVRPADLIVCLDGHVEAEEIRKKNWGVNPDLPAVPLLHLVIPRTVDHIMRYTSSALSGRTRLHTILATLSQLRAQGEIGRAMSHTPKTSEAADEIVQFLTPHEDASSLVEWPLPPIGSIKDVIEFQTQQSEDIASPARGKRPLEDDALDTGKRMRFTPQAGAPSSSANNETTHISDSMPGTAVSNEKLYQQVAELKDEIQRLRDREASWSKQQIAHEERGRSYVTIKFANESLTKKLETSTAREATLKERLETRTTELHDLATRHKALQDMMAASSDTKTIDIARLAAEVYTANVSLARETKAKQAADAQFDYLKEQYRTAQDAASAHRAERDTALAQVAELEKRASGEVRALAELHYRNQGLLIQDRETQALNELRIVKAHNQTLTAQVAQLKSGRGVGVGTRAQSSRPGSRAASPMHRDRVANLRNG